MKVKNLESMLNCSSLPSGTVRRGGGYKPLNRDGVLNLPHDAFRTVQDCGSLTLRSRYKTLSKRPNDRSPDGIETGAQSKKGGSMTKNTYREEFNRLTDGCSARFCFALLAHVMGLSEYHAHEIVKNAKEEHYKKAIKLYKSMMGEEEE